ncbi:tryptophan synthase subunit beta [Micromonospora endophytica]|uniref:Tryptophan synthase beta chain n=1 Tax=Micromonospora endophytica TaxID=515350 RepID=A0A2W2CCM5_9ACTN|nr:tryptophan synthase subunit beta [Micromonospora endophytica]PZF95470.1 tryptophan synthase subunit beta [Micromonospora endophytica]RIW51509.1 tryptophan synthase subunit beta [Micromonospora endophytica]BCJ62100.1 tryptophan synthase beta chain [Micromonospora endophytica]
MDHLLPGPKTAVSRRPTGLGRFGEYGGRFVPESLVPACAEVEQAFTDAWADPLFRAELRHVLAIYVGRPTPVTPAARLSAELGVNLLLKREDLAHTGSHKINNVLGQALLARRMGKRRLIAETGAGQHGVATATAGALLGMPTTVLMGERDIERQQLNVFRMTMLGAEVIPVTSGTRTLKDACSEALRHWVTSVEDSYYCLGSAMGPHPYPWMVREFQRVIGDEARTQCAADLATGTPDFVVACVGGGSNAAGTFAGFVDTPALLVGVEAAGGAAISAGSPGVLHGFRSKVLQDEHGQIAEAHSIAAGLDYPGVGPEHAYLADLGRASYVCVDDAEVLAATHRLARTEGILCALESAHAVAWVIRAAGDGTIPPDATVLLTLSGRGDKDMATLMELS